jgi:hypothetical protein
MTTALADILREWQSNLSFREAFKKDPELALKEAGFTVSTEDLAKVQAMLKFDQNNNERLDDRISK